MLLHALFRRLPTSVRHRFRRILGAAGHGRSILDVLRARENASGKKRLDRSLRHIVDVLGESGVRCVVDRDCLDFGAGYVPSDGVALWLLGARSVTAVDYNSIASFGYLRAAIRDADVAAIENLMSVNRAVHDWRARLRALHRAAVHDSSSPQLDGVPFRYISPLDAISKPEQLPEYDLLWSTSVLEHIRPSQILPLLRSLKVRGREGSIQLHRVDLRDHRDAEGAPYGFLDRRKHFDPENEADERGNAMNIEAWEALLESDPELKLRIRDVSGGRPHLLPMYSGRAVLQRVADFITVSNLEANAGFRP